MSDETTVRAADGAGVTAEREEAVREGAGREGADALSDYVEIKYLSPAEATFQATPGGFVRLSLATGEEYPRINVHRAFPLTLKDRYISVRDMEGNEIGMIENLHDFPQEVVQLIEGELERRYFTPVIKRIESIKEEFGYAYWSVDTDVGQRRFTVRDMHANVIPLSAERVFVVDVDGNRYDIPDYTALDPKSRKLLENLL